MTGRRRTSYSDPVGWLWGLVALGASIWVLTLIPVIGHAIAVGFVILLFAVWLLGKFRREWERGRRR